MAGRKSASIRLSPKVRTEVIPGYTIFTDTETRESDNGELSLVLGCYEVWATDSRGLGVTELARGTYRDVAEFYAIVGRYLNCRIIAHNWNFDATVLTVGRSEVMATAGYSIDLARSIVPPGGGQYAPFLLTLDFGDGGYAELLCNTNYYKMPLADIGAAFGLPKMAMPGPDNPAELERYCRRDVAILRRAYFGVFAFSDDIAGVTPGITAAMAANRIYRKAFFATDKIVQGSQHIARITAIEKSAYHGGRTDCFYKGVPDADTIFKYDVNSLYPACMRGDIPIRYLQASSGRYFDAPQPGLMALAIVTLNIPADTPLGFIGLEGIFTADGLVFPAGRFECALWEPLLKIAMREGYVERIHRVLLYECDAIFDGYVAELFARRQAYKRDGNLAFDLLTKLMLNSLYGKFAQRREGEWAEVAGGTAEYEAMAFNGLPGIERFTGMFTDTECDYMQVGERLYRYDTPPDGALAVSSVLSIAGYITAMGRAVLWNAMATVIRAGGRVFYCDTDSVMADIPLPDGMVSATALGQWKLEGTSPGRECHFYAPKHYVYKGEVKLKGIRNPQSAAGSFEQAIFPNFMTDLTSGNPSRRERLETGALIRYITKTPTGDNNKRIEQGAGLPTLPHTVDMMYATVKVD